MVSRRVIIFEDHDRAECNFAAADGFHQDAQQHLFDAKPQKTENQLQYIRWSGAPCTCEKFNGVCSAITFVHFQMRPDWELEPDSPTPLAAQFWAFSTTA
jgi:hypothetical protein